ncbi:hypothetical protein OS122_19215 [Mycolicibacterium mucogenicum]|uniref:hypothetical protein n=1 Tax=Mycolicibacterium mucogenicum TaxID=56689 RepID=UPI002269BADB|nr:hypothetical protein [Mycolicibacterium mucogenicum]MCX8563029.1 hypothetical protein [Mycolicibacterium mucogenicum]
MGTNAGTAITVVAGWLAAALIGGTLICAPIANADTDPFVPYGTDPAVPTASCHRVSNHDEVDTTSGFVDQAF